jgi:hypothetical protein
MKKKKRKKKICLLIAPFVSFSFSFYPPKNENVSPRNTKTKQKKKPALSFFTSFFIKILFSANLLFEPLQQPANTLIKLRGALFEPALRLVRLWLLLLRLL